MRGLKHEPFIITPIAAFDLVKQEKELREAFLQKPHCVEWRVDLYRELLDVSQFKAVIHRIKTYLAPETKLMVTLKSSSIRFVECAMKHPDVDFVDIDFEEFMELDLQFPLTSKIVLSHHNTKEMVGAEKLRQLAEKMVKLAEIIKLAVVCKNNEEALELFTLPSLFENKKVIVVPIGKNVSNMRLLAHKYGSFASYASLLNSTAEGQIPFADMKYIISKG